MHSLEFFLELDCKSNMLCIYNDGARSPTYKVYMIYVEYRQFEEKV